MQIKYKKKAVKYINSADSSTKKRLREAIEKIPFGDTIENDIVTINDIKPRGQVYKKL